MKHILKKLICIVFIFNSCASSDQKVDHKLETIYMNCVYSSLPDNGVELITILKKDEQMLIKEKILKDGSGESYIALYQNIEKATDGKLQDLATMTYLMKMMEQDIYQDAYVSCLQEFMQNPKFFDSKLQKLMSLRTSKNNEISIKTYTQYILTAFRAADFEHNYYKYFTILLLDIYLKEGIQDQDIDRSLPEQVTQQNAEKVPENAFKIEMQPEQKLFANGEKIAPKSLRKKVISYLVKNTSENVIVLKYDKMISYKFYISVQNEILQAYKIIRDKASKEKFKRTYDELTADEQEEIKKIYPRKIIE